MAFPIEIFDRCPVPKFDRSGINCLKDSGVDNKNHFVDSVVGLVGIHGAAGCGHKAIVIVNVNIDEISGLLPVKG